VLGIVMTGLSAFLFDVALALVTLGGTATLLWGWFVWLAGRAEWMPRATDAPRARPSVGSSSRGEPDPGPPSASRVARAEIAELETLWELSRGDRDDPPHGPSGR